MIVGKCLIRIVDDFFRTPHLERTRALVANYQDISHGGLVFPKFSPHEDNESLEKLNQLLGGTYAFTLPPSYRAYHYDDKQPTYIHVDSNECDVSVVVFLNESYHEGHGLCFWAPRVDEPTSFNEADWTQTYFCQGKFNRAVVFDSKIPHGRYPQSNWLNSDNNVRLVKVLFLKELK